MRIKVRRGISIDGYAATPDGTPTLIKAAGFVSRQSHGYPEFIQGCGTVVMGRHTFLAALAASRWPRRDMQVFGLTSRPLPAATPATSSPPACKVASGQTRINNALLCVGAKALFKIDYLKDSDTPTGEFISSSLDIEKWIIDTFKLDGSCGGHRPLRRAAWPGIQDDPQAWYSMRTCRASLLRKGKNGTLSLYTVEPLCQPLGGL